ncbi:hypothetical protein ACFY0G_02075 [Streptomyces sp. NPDC001552]|uniref:hypothetical protein n=1 Tax=Streptomyces sp. NPDC001552 TaxID=3364587 RepID=UPI0036BD8CE9
MTTSAVLAPPLMFTPSDDPAPVEQAVALSIAASYPPETYLWIECHRPDGGMQLWHAWTQGGDVLGDHVDQVAVASGLDAPDWFEIAGRHEQVAHRGRIVIRAHPLRPVLADVKAGVRCPHDRRAGLRQLIVTAAGLSGQVPHTHMPRWFGVGPVLATRPH